MGALAVGGLVVIVFLIIVLCPEDDEIMRGRRR